MDPTALSFLSFKCQPNFCDTDAEIALKGPRVLPILQKSSSSESLSEKGSELKKSFDAVVFDVLKVTPEEYAVSLLPRPAPVFARNVHVLLS